MYIDLCTFVNVIFREFLKIIIKLPLGVVEKAGF